MANWLNFLSPISNMGKVPLSPLASVFGADTSTGNMVHQANQAVGGVLPQYSWLDQLMNQQQKNMRRPPMLSSTLGRYGGLG